MTIESADLAAELTLALHLADLADEVTMRHFRSQSLVVETKADQTEVTIADRSTEDLLRVRINAARPTHGVLGEEHGVTDAAATSRWIIDPIDGTSNYVRGVPVWATLIALEVDGHIELGVVSAPALGRRWWATKGFGAFLNGDRLRVSEVSDLQHAFLSYSEGPWTQSLRRGGIDALRATVGRERAFGDFWQHMLVAEGAIDIAAECIVSLWDLAAIKIIVEEAGGMFTDLSGQKRADGGSAVSTNGILHADVLSTLAGT